MNDGIDTLEGMWKQIDSDVGYLDSLESFVVTFIGLFELIYSCAASCAVRSILVSEMFL